MFYPMYMGLASILRMSIGIGKCDLNIFSNVIQFIYVNDGRRISSYEKEMMDKDGFSTALDNLPFACHNLVRFAKIILIRYYITSFGYYKNFTH